MIGIRVFTPAKDIVEAISEPYVKVRPNDEYPEAFILVKDLVTNRVYELDVDDIMAVPTTIEYATWNEGVIEK